MVFVTIVVVALLYIFAYWPNSPFGKQLQNLKLAEQQASLLREKFKDDLIFKQITFHRYTAFGGCLSISGKVFAEEDVHHITNLVESIKGPAKIFYSLTASNEAFVFEWLDGDGQAPTWIKPDSK